MTETLSTFTEYLKTFSHYNQAITQFYWDLQTQAPEKGYAYKVDAIAYFSTELFKLSTSEEYGRLLQKLAEPSEFELLDEGMKLTVKRRKKEYDKYTHVPSEFYEEFVREKAGAEKVWEKAKQTSDYALFCPQLQKLIDMTKRLMQYTNPGEDVYDALLDLYEEGMDSATIDRLFTDMKEGLLPLIRRIREKPEPDRCRFQGRFDIQKQKELGAFLLEYIGFDSKAGVMSESEHPFTMGFGPRDVRITNHYSEKEAVNAMFSIIHEGGHAIFEQGVDKIYENTDVERINLLGLHESQSRFYENILGRNINFWKPIYRKVEEYLPQFQSIGIEEFFREINHITPSYIRTEADELTYCFHIILRYEIEKAIFRENVKAKDLPQLWNAKMQEFLGICPRNDAEGILQDMHWSDGSMGYFPAYLLGTIYDGMFLAAMEADLGPVDTVLAEGRIAEITAWLHNKIHRFGSLRTSKEVIKEVCGREISARPIIEYFIKKYEEIYGLK